MNDDLDRIMAVMAAAFDPAFGEAWSRRQVEDALLLGQCHYHLIATTGTEPAEHQPAAGFALLRQTCDEAELLLFAIMPDQRRRGLGAQLLARLMAAARARGTTRMLLEMRRGNPAEALYRAQGFELVGLRPQYYRGANNLPTDALTFACPLQ